MKYVDEYRDGELGRALATEIVATVEPGRHYKVMEVCGGHTHTIYKYGVDDLLPANVELVHGPGCPVCVIPMGRVDDGIAVARRPEVIFTCFGDMMRVPGGGGTLLEAKAEGADVRMVYSPLDALRIARENPDREVVFFAIGFETTAPSTALTLLRAQRRARAELLRLLQPRHDRAAAAALLESPDLRLDGFIGPGHVSTVIGARPFEFIPREYGKPVVISGFEPLDLLQSVQMVLRQLADGRCEVENQYTRVVPYDGNQQALDVMSQVFELRPHFEWRGLGFIPRSGLKLSRGLRRLRRRAPLRRAGRARRRPEGMSVRRGAEGRDQAVGVQGLRHRLHARAPDRHVHGVVRGRVRGLLQLRPLRARARGGLDGHPDEDQALELIDRVRAKPLRFRDERITMAHGAGGKASLALVEALLAPALGIDELDDAAVVDDLALTTDTFVVNPIRFPGGSIGELAVNGTVNDLAVSGARPLALTLSLVLEEGLAADDLRAEVEAARAAELAGVAIVGGDTKVVERGRCDGSTSRRRASAVLDPRLAVPDHSGPATASSSRARSAITAWRSCWRAASSSWRRRSCPTRARSGRQSTPCSTPPARHCGRARRDARRRRHRAQRACARRGRRDPRRRGCRPGAPSVAAPARSSASTRCTWRTKASSSPSSRPRRPAARSPRSAPSPAARRPPRSARCDGPAGPRARRRGSAAGASWTCWWATRFRGSADRHTGRIVAA